MRRLSTRTDFTFGFAAAICACWMIAAFFSDHFETGGKRSDIYSWISLRPYRNPEACIGVRLRMATSLFIWPVGNAQTLFSGISYSPYRNPEAGGVRTSGHRRPASSSDLYLRRCLYFELRVQPMFRRVRFPNTRNRSAAAGTRLARRLNSPREPLRL